MTDDTSMRRLRAARPPAGEHGDRDGLFARIVAGPGDPRLLEAAPGRSLRRPARTVRPWTRSRPRALALSSLGLAGIAGALVLALSGPTAQSAFAITRSGDGSVLVKINAQGWFHGSRSLPEANLKLAQMGIRERLTIYMASGPAAVRGPVTCTPAPGSKVPGPTLRVLIGENGTEVISPGETGGNTGVGTWHLDHCVVTPAVGSGASGNTGAG